MVKDNKRLTEKQDQVLQFIESRMDDGYPFPSLAQIGDKFGYSRNSAKVHVNALEKKGYIQKREQRVSPFMLAHECAVANQAINHNQFNLMAHVPAGAPDLVQDDFDRHVSFDHTYFAEGQVKAIVVAGDSMLGDSICEGDIGIVQIQKNFRKNDIVAVRVEGDGVTLKRVEIKGDKAQLIPSNPEFKVKEVPAEQVEVIGKLVGVVRRT